jgi:hypothetical protein
LVLRRNDDWALQQFRHVLCGTCQLRVAGRMLKGGLHACRGSGEQICMFILGFILPVER